MIFEKILCSNINFKVFIIIIYQDDKQNNDKIYNLNFKKKYLIGELSRLLDNDIKSKDQINLLKQENYKICIQNDKLISNMQKSISNLMIQNDELKLKLKNAEDTISFYNKWEKSIREFANQFQSNVKIILSS